jgi:hypothetical protein
MARVSAFQSKFASSISGEFGSEGVEERLAFPACSIAGEGRGIEIGPLSGLLEVLGNSHTPPLSSGLSRSIAQCLELDRGGDEARTEFAGVDFSW